ncbi:tRNA (guanosine(37)-N1)-methyltransferase TrmD [candidate division WWE3 bacterium RIFCSPLOWO2_02_FULL_53_10]|uniref:tRNA (guanine-N(1)-)-methyltransferase n=2 Tax=Katanobacteria TaxID=422282 RepID=A0A1F4W7Y5_UNCKA|nr:MAG: tRNA (guanosine(37)-N1)-methyltransferase TrmD [candidate division WWE3 bacterium RIFCSPLOWO2_01_FULL_53_14]OGC65545.1 MAG: tRNA (guanosine(37)-N1)-methyltransferase TrmD [candidate division WWE3 bacterium RIFCSPLOWO2_02_FULL_53_10]
MVISVITLFPQVFHPILESSILDKAQKKGKLKVNLVDLREFGIGKYRQVDDRIYGGGVGMILRIEPIAAAIQKSKISNLKSKIVLLEPAGKKFDQKMARRLTKEKHLVLICGKYEGVDERVRKLADEVISIGDYVLSGGEIAAMAVIDSVARLLPGVLEKEATEHESFSTHTLLEPPQYTRPENFEGMEVPKILLSGDHQEIAKWREKEALKKTKRLRPDLT